ncbi:MAG: adenosylmethionine--8-amino-7-oxononanoate transaminase [Myxococcales bacterium]|nr:MAG: adenosylmethionine--8-amino-7-oxononanoate transaminase [Myxococcales bacterium]
MERRRLIELDRKLLWRPYTAFEDHQEQEPLVIERAEGVRLYDVNGQSYIDANGSWWTNTLGHGHPRIKAALVKQTQSLMHCAFAGISHEPAVLLAKDLLDVAPKGLSRVFFSDDGSTSIEVAIKMAFQYWQQNSQPKRTRFISLSNAFHGDTLGATSLGGVQAFRKVFGPILFDVLRTPEADDAQGWEKAIDAIEVELKQNATSFAAVIVEPLIQGAAGMQIWPASLLARLHSLCKKHDVFLIADEVFTGYGRTGKMWACDHATITPDILCTAKAFSAGAFPMAATLATDRIYDGFKGGKERALMYGHTFYGNPLGASIAREVLAVYRDEKIIEQVNQKAPLLAQAFDDLGAHPGVTRTRHLGLVAAADLGKNNYYGNAGWLVYEEAKARGVYLRPLGNTVYIAPPLVIGNDELEELLATIAASIDAAYEKAPWS